MFISGLLSSMNIWVDKWSDIRWSLNDIYMALLMNGWMFMLMGLYYFNYIHIIFGSILVIISILAIRLQLFINIKQFAIGMIPHHSMAVFMSKKILTKNQTLLEPLKALVLNIITTQEKEIDILKLV